MLICWLDIMLLVSCVIFFALNTTSLMIGHQYILLMLNCALHSCLIRWWRGGVGHRLHHRRVMLLGTFAECHGKREDCYLIIRSTDNLITSLPETKRRKSRLLNASRAFVNPISRFSPIAPLSAFCERSTWIITADPHMCCASNWSSHVSTSRRMRQIWLSVSICRYSEA